MEREDFWMKALRTLYGLNEITKHKKSSDNYVRFGKSFPPLQCTGNRSTISRTNRNNTISAIDREGFFQERSNILQNRKKESFNAIRKLFDKIKKKVLK